MGFFSNKDKPCPVCGNATPRLLAKKFQGEAICSKCADNIMADTELIKGWSINDLKEHIRYREENQNLLQSFVPTRTVDYDREMIIDDTNQMFYIDQFTVENPQIFRFNEILGFEMKLNYHTVESWSRGMERTPYRPPALGLASGLSMLAEAFGANDDDDNKKSQYETLKVILQVNSKYLKEYELCDLSISGRGAAEFEHDFSRELAKADTVCNLIVSMASGGVSTASESSSAKESTVSSADKTADGIKKFKELLDAGIITQEEFNAKKKQLLGI